MKFTRHKIVFFLTLALLAVFDTAAQTDRERGIESYNKGNFSQAAALFERTARQKEFSRDAEIWNYLGLSYTNQNKNKEARKAFEKAVKFAPQSSIYHANLAYAWLLNKKPNNAQSSIQKAIQLDPKNANAYYIRGTSYLWEGKNQRAIADAGQAVSLNPKFTAAYILLSDALLDNFGDAWGENSNPRNNLNLLERAADSLKKCLADCPADESLKTVNQRVDMIGAFLDYFNRTKTPYERTENTQENLTPLAITYKPKPKYTDQARQENVSGNVRIAVMFGADGRTKYLMPIKSLRFGLTEQALKAASGIRFEPQKIDGKPVSVVKVVVFTFTIY